MPAFATLSNLYVQSVIGNALYKLVLKRPNMSGMKKGFILLPALFIFILQTHAQLWKTYEDRATNFWEQNKADSTIKYYQESVRQYTLQNATPDSNYARIMGNLVFVYRSLNQFDKSEQTNIELLTAIENKIGKNNLLYIEAANKIVDTYLTTGKYDKAEAMLLSCDSVIPQIPGDNRYAHSIICNGLAVFYRHFAKYDKAEHYYLETLKLLEQVGNQDMGYAITINNLGVLYKFTGRYNDAEKCMLKAKQIKAAVFGITHEEYAITCSTIGLLYKDLGRYDEAKLLFLEARKIIEAKFTKNYFEYASFTYNLASIYLFKGEYDKAEACFMEAKEIQEKIYKKDHPEKAMLNQDLGRMYYELGQFEKSLVYQEKGKRITENVFGKVHPEYAIVCNNIAGVYFAMNDASNAEAYAIEAKKCIEQLEAKNPALIIANNSILLSIYINRGDYLKAENIALESLDSIQKYFSAGSASFVSTCYNLGLLYTKIDKLDKSEFYQQQAYATASAILGSTNLFTIRSGFELAALAWKKRNYERADSLFSRNWSCLQSQREQQFSFQNEAEKQSFIDLIEAASNTICSFYMDYVTINQNKSQQLINVLLQRKLVLLDALKELRMVVNSQNDLPLQKKFNDWIYLKEQLAYWLTKPVNDRNGFDKELEEKTDSLEKEITRLSSGFRQRQINKLKSWQEIQAYMQPGDAAIEFFRLPYNNGNEQTDSMSYAAVLIKKEQATPELIHLFGEKQLEAMLFKRSTGTDNVRINYFYKPNETSYSVAKKLYDMIWKPLELKLKGVSKIYFSPAEILYKISFGALPVNSTETLSDKYKLQQLNSLSSLLQQGALPVLSTKDVIYFYGDILYDADSTNIREAANRYAGQDIAFRSVPEDLLRSGDINGWPPLPASKQEINEIVKLASAKKITVSVFKQLDATEESVKSLTGKISPSVIHFSTHGFFYPDQKSKKELTDFSGGKIYRQSGNPMLRSGIVLAGANNTWNGKSVTGVQDGILTAYEVSNMYLPKTKLVVLSACETGLGDIQGNEGVYGLQRAFKIAGVKNLIMSLWKVPDKETAEFMTNLYKNMFDGLSIENAFYTTQTIMRNKYRNDPYKWAAWILVR